MRLLHKALPLALVLGVAALGTQLRDAAACGGCFAPPDTPSTVNSHRMAVKITDESTILWDQIRYSGDPSDFVWVLPMPAVGSIDLAAPEFFDDLEIATAPQIFNPLICSGTAGGGFFRGAPNAAATDSEASDGEDVMVYYQGAVGPYETVTIGSEDPGALVAWLNDHGYAVPESTLPTIAHYVEMNNVFIALRLAPEFGVEQMQPVRVTIPGRSITFPLQMVKVGSGTDLGLTLWVFGDARFHSMNYPDATVRDEDIVWDSNLGRSNYVELFDKAVLDAAGKGWVTEFAEPAGYVWLGSSTDAPLATEGLATPYLTRLRTNMRVFLMDADLFLEPSWSIGDVSNQHFPTSDVAYPNNNCNLDENGDQVGGSGWFVGGGCSVVAPARHATACGALALLAATGGLAFVARRRARRARRAHR